VFVETVSTKTATEKPTQTTTTGTPSRTSTPPPETTLDETPTEEPMQTTTEEPTSATTTKSTPGSSTTPQPEEAVRSVGGVRVSLTDLIARKAVAYDSVMGSGGVLASPDRQFVVAAVRSASDGEFDAAAPPGRDAFSLSAGGETVPAAAIEERTTGAYTTSLADRGDSGYAVGYAGGHAPVGWIVFEPPSPLTAEEATISCRYGGESATWSLPNAAIDTLASPAPVFELQSFSATPAGSGVDLSLVAANTSDTDGEFLAAVYWPTTAIADDDESHLVRREVAAGEQVEWSKRVDARNTNTEDGTVTARVDGVVTGETSVEVGTRTQI
jgi:hypothetical protein